MGPWYGPVPSSDGSEVWTSVWYVVSNEYIGFQIGGQTKGTAESLSECNVNLKGFRFLSVF